MGTGMGMGIFSLEHGRVAYWADLGFYVGAVLAVSALLVCFAPHAQRLGLVALVAVGLASWSIVEYALHRFVLHGLAPFAGWHARHHERPNALIASPTPMSAALIVALVFAPAWLLAGPWPAAAFTDGVTAGYLAYSLAHHATHHKRATGPWASRRKRWHALHHHHAGPGCCYGVTSGFWDRVFGSAPVPRRPAPVGAGAGLGGPLLPARTLR